MLREGNLVRYKSIDSFFYGIIYHAEQCGKKDYYLKVLWSDGDFETIYSKIQDIEVLA
jgi:hypothetical protein